MRQVRISLLRAFSWFLLVTIVSGRGQTQFRSADLAYDSDFLGQQVRKGSTSPAHSSLAGRPGATALDQQSPSLPASMSDSSHRHVNALRSSTMSRSLDMLRSTKAQLTSLNIFIIALAVFVCIAVAILCSLDDVEEEHPDLKTEHIITTATPAPLYDQAHVPGPSNFNRAQRSQTSGTPARPAEVVQSVMNQAQRRQPSGIGSGTPPRPAEVVEPHPAERLEETPPPVTQQMQATPSMDSEADQPDDLAPTCADLCRLWALKGTWAQTYESGDDSVRQALELVYQCKIIPRVEFGESIVNTRHIDESVWIATEMLSQKSLAEWVGNKPEARRIFQESVTILFDGRAQALASEDAVSSISGGTSRYAEEASRSVPMVPSDLLARCREIMKETDRNRGTSPWHRARQAGVPSSVQSAGASSVVRSLREPRSASPRDDLQASTGTIPTTPRSTRTDRTLASTVKAASVGAASFTTTAPSRTQPRQGRETRSIDLRQGASLTSISQSNPESPDQSSTGNGVPVVLAPRAETDDQQYT